jgi:hypothetical protein
LMNSTTKIRDPTKARKAQEVNFMARSSCVPA